MAIAWECQGMVTKFFQSQNLLKALNFWGTYNFTYKRGFTFLFFLTFFSMCMTCNTLKKGGEGLHALYFIIFVILIYLQNKICQAIKLREK
jgi:hypothetical protein